MDNGLHVPAWNGRRAARALDDVKRKGRANDTPCCICQQPIDYDLPSTDPDGPSVQHIKSRALFPHLTWDVANHAPAHLGCNKAEGKTPTIAIGQTSRRW